MLNKTENSHNCQNKNKRNEDGHCISQQEFSESNKTPPKQPTAKRKFSDYSTIFLTLFNLEQSKNPKQTPVTLSLQVKMLCTQCNFNNFMNQNYKPETFKAL